MELLKQDKFTIEHVNDLVRQCVQQNRVVYSDFLNLHEQAIVLSQMTNQITYKLIGGYEMAERKVFAFYPKNDPDQDEQPYVFLKIQLPKLGIKRKPNHRDFLGAILNTGIERRNVGDLLIFDTYAIVIVLKTIAGFVIENLNQIGNITITIDYAENQAEWLSYEPSFDSIKTTIASNRLDNLLKAGAKLSRSSSGAYIKSGKVFVDGKEITQSSFEAQEGSVVSVRGIGKFRLTRIGELSKKGRLYIEIDIYR